MTHLTRHAWLLLGHLSLALGIVGIFLPLLPTTPFILLASACYSKGSEKFSHWLEHHPRFGPTLVQWREDRVISPKAKLMAMIAIIASGLIVGLRASLITEAKVVALLSLVGVSAFILSRPSQTRVLGRGE